MTNFCYFLNFTLTENTLCAFLNHITCICPLKLLSNPWRHLLLALLVPVHGSWGFCFGCKAGEQCSQHQPMLLVSEPQPELPCVTPSQLQRKRVTWWGIRLCYLTETCHTVLEDIMLPAKSKHWRHNPYTSNMAVIRDRPFREVIDPNPIWQAHQNTQRNQGCVHRGKAKSRRVVTYKPKKETSGERRSANFSTHIILHFQTQSY